jgi:hypothetical protein
MHEDIKMMLNSVNAATIYFRTVFILFANESYSSGFRRRTTNSYTKTGEIYLQIWMKVSRGKKKTTDFKSRDTVRSKTVSSNITEKTNTSSYLGCTISYRNLKYITVKVSEFLQIRGTINRNFKHSKIQKHIRLKTHYALALHTLLYGSET